MFQSPNHFIDSSFWLSAEADMSLCAATSLVQPVSLNSSRGSSEISAGYTRRHLSVCRSGFLAALDGWLHRSWVSARAGGAEPWMGSWGDHTDGLERWSRAGSRGLRQECRDRAGSVRQNTGGRTDDGAGHRLHMRLGGQLSCQGPWERVGEKVRSELGQKRQKVGWSQGKKDKTSLEPGQEAKRKQTRPQRLWYRYFYK